MKMLKLRPNLLAAVIALLILIKGTLIVAIVSPEALTEGVISLISVAVGAIVGLWDKLLKSDQDTANGHNGDN